MRSALAPHLSEVLPALSKQDYEEAKQCLVNRNNNGGVLLLVRSVEVGFKAYYTDITGRDPGAMSWDELEKDVPQTRYDPYVMNAVKDVRRYYRNRVTHPERDYVLSNEDTVRTFYACSEALARLAESKFKKEMPRSA